MKTYSIAVNVTLEFAQIARDENSAKEQAEQHVKQIFEHYYHIRHTVSPVGFKAWEEPINTTTKRRK